MRRRSGWLIAAVLLFAVSAALMLYGEKPAPPAPKVEVQFPRSFRGNEWERMEKRRTLPASPEARPTPAPSARAPGEPARQRDPVLAALGISHRQSAVVIEANALRYSPVGQLLLDCLANSRSGKNPLQEFKERSGVDVLQDLDRVAIMDEGLLLSGNFSRARWGELLKDRARPGSYGDKAVIYEPIATTGKDGKPYTPNDYVTSWGDQMLFIGDSAESARALVDQLEGRAPPNPPLLTEEQTYGEIYGVLASNDMAKLVPQDQAALAERLRTVADRIELHVDATRDVGIVAEFQGKDPSQMEDLARSLGAAMSLARMKAQADGDPNTAELLDFTRIKPSGGRFNMEMALPLEVLERQLAICRDRKAAQGAQPQGQQPAP